MSEKKRTYESNANALPMSLMSVRSEKEQASDVETRLLAHLEQVKSTSTNLSLSRELILRLIEVLKQL